MQESRLRKWWRDPRTLLRTILMLDDTSHSIALGTAIGVFIGLSPTGGIQMMLVMLTSLLTRKFFRFNVMAALITVYISNPLTAIPILWSEYQIGTLFFERTVTKDDFVRMIEFGGGATWWDSVVIWWHSVVALAYKIGAPLVVGSIVLGGICAILTYPAVRAMREWLGGDDHKPDTTHSESSDKSRPTPAPTPTLVN
jgi:uncharacterized protein (DUF2062 family)